MYKIIGKFIENDVWLSRQTVKGILTSDLVLQLEEKAARRPMLSVDEYIKDFIQRLDNIEKNNIDIEKGW